MGYLGLCVTKRELARLVRQSRNSFACHHMERKTGRTPLGHRFKSLLDRRQALLRFSALLCCETNSANSDRCPQGHFKVSADSERSEAGRIPTKERLGMRMSQGTNRFHPSLLCARFLRPKSTAARNKMVIVRGGLLPLDFNKHGARKTMAHRSWEPGG